MGIMQPVISMNFLNGNFLPSASMGESEDGEALGTQSATSTRGTAVKTGTNARARKGLERSIHYSFF